MNNITTKVNEAFKKEVKVLIKRNFSVHHGVHGVLHSAYLLNVEVTNRTCSRDDIHIVLICNIYYSYSILVETETDLKEKELRSSIVYHFCGVYPFLTHLNIIDFCVDHIYNLPV